MGSLSFINIKIHSIVYRNRNSSHVLTPSFIPRTITELLRHLRCFCIRSRCNYDKDTVIAIDSYEYSIGL